MHDWLRAAASEAGERAFLLLPDGSEVSFSEMEDDVQRLVGSIRAMGIGRGDVVAVIPRNDRVSVARMFAIPRTGAACLLLNARLTEGEIRAQMSRVGAKAAFEGLGELPEPPAPGAPDAFLDVLASSDHSILFTSGSTGTPKAVRLTWENLDASAAASAELLSHDERDRWYASLPIYHVGGMSILIRSARQRSAVYLEPTFDPERAAALFIDGTATLGSVVAPMLGAILEAEPGPYRGVKALLVGGGAVPIELLTTAIEAGLPVLPTYGMTETASQIATRPLEDALRPGLSAVPIPGADIRIASDGVIEVAGPMVSPGYVGEPDREGRWFRTSDLGSMAEDRLTVIGRADDVIVTGGENVHPAEVEVVIAEVAGVTGVVVVGVPHTRWGEEVVAVVEGDVAPGALDRHARYHLAGYKIPKRWVLVTSLPRLSIGKPDRRAALQIAVGEA